jgi:hypothetical protein
MRSKRRKGAILIFALLFILITLLLAGLLVDLGGTLMTKQQAIAASENAGMDALTEFYPPVYQPIGIINNPNQWPGQLRQAPTRTRATLRAADHEAGYTIELLDRSGGVVGPTSTELTVYFGATSPYVPDVQTNSNNDPAGDILLGRWEKTPGGPYKFLPVQGPGQPGGFANLPRSIEVMIRRTDEPRVDGVREGDNPIPFLFRRAAWTGETGVDPGVYRNRGERLEAVNTVSLVPAATVGQGAVLPYQGGTARVGTMPLVLVLRPAVKAWILANDPAQPLTFDIDNNGPMDAGAEAYWTHYGVSPPAAETVIARMLNFLRGAAPAIPPPQLSLDTLVPRPAIPPGRIRQLTTALSNGFRQQTWMIPVVTNANANATNCRIVGFLHVYCENVIDQAPANANDGVVLRLAPSASGRSGIPLRGALPAAIETEFFDTFWQTVDGQRVGPRPFGIACAGATVRYGHVRK